ncbi:MAG: carboxypeptidase-like regulatory domain-containing protein [Deltaproteobacteria bacterium]|nr:carboxypeptidase-like regulatory domain-containing protein [Deltaproteobacteria bacterium]
MTLCSGCRGRSKGPPLQLVRTPAAGRPDVCPDDAVDPHGDTTPSAMHLRCSYADAAGGTPTRVKGRVSVEGAPGSLGDSPGRIAVVVHQAPRAVDGPPGPKVAEATTDPQGTFSIGALLRPGEYVVVVADVPGRGPPVQRRITVGGEAGHTLSDVQLVIPRARMLADEDPSQ